MRKKKCTYFGGVVTWRAGWGPARFRRSRPLRFFGGFFCVWLVSSSSFYCLTWDTIKKKRSVGSKCCASACHRRLARLLHRWNSGKKTKKKHLLTVQVAHIRPLCHKVPQTPVRQVTPFATRFLHVGFGFHLPYLFVRWEKKRKKRIVGKLFFFFF